MHMGLWPRDKAGKNVKVIFLGLLNTAVAVIALAALGQT